MKQFNNIKGREGEELAAKYLKKHGYKILDKNYTCPIGEIDIVASIAGYLVFVEVKARDDEIFGRPSEAVDEFKQRKLYNLALMYQRTKKLADMPVRFDVVEVLDDEINHIKNAF